MDRPTVLLLAVGIAVVAGCTAPIGGQPIEGTTVTVGDATAAPGEVATVSVEATNVGWMGFDLPGDLGSSPVRVDFANATASPPPDTVWTSYPPGWTWSTTRHRVVVELPVHVSEEAEPGTYRLAVTVGENAGAEPEEEVTGTGDITVERPDGGRT